VIFENYYELQTDWEVSAEGYNVLETQMLNSFVAGGGMPGSPASTDSFTSPMPDKIVYWEDLDMPVGSMILLLWSDFAVTPSTLRFKDVMGNEARASPLTFVYSIPLPVVMQHVLPKLEAELVSVDGAEAVIRFTRHECPIPGLTGFEQAGMEWETDTPYTADPDEPLNTDKMIITVPAGTYKVAVVQKIYLSSPFTEMPPAMIEMVVEVI
jgi:hypothetical protein